MVRSAMIDAADKFAEVDRLKFSSLLDITLVPTSKFPTKFGIYGTAFCVFLLVLGALPALGISHSNQESKRD